MKHPLVVCSVCVTANKNCRCGSASHGTVAMCEAPDRGHLLRRNFPRQASLTRPPPPPPPPPLHVRFPYPLRINPGPQSEVSTDIKIDLEEFEELWVEKAEKVAAKKKVSPVLLDTVDFCGGIGVR